MPLNNRISPGSKNWIAKYFELADNEIISLSLNENNDDLEDLLELVSSKTGLVFGVANSFIFTNHLNNENYTSDESIKLLLFESLILAYLQRSREEFNKDAFIQSLCQFYKIWKDGGWVDKWLKGNQTHELEKILSMRVKVNTSIFGTNYWINHLSNALLFLDVLLFIEFLEGKSFSYREKRDKYAFSVLTGIVAAALADGLIDPKEQKIIDHLLASADLPRKFEQELERYMNKTNTLGTFDFENKQLAKITFKLALFLTEGNTFNVEEKEERTQLLGNQFKLSSLEIEECRLTYDAFIFDSNVQLNQIKEENQIKLVYKGFSNRWIRILGRNKEKFVNELNESKELLALIKKSAQHELTKEEKEKVKTQFMDVLKTVPSIGIFLLPGGAILLPLILKIVPDLMPSAFKENEIKKK